MFDFSELVAAWNETLPLFGQSVSAWVDGLAINSVVVMALLTKLWVTNLVMANSGKKVSTQWALSLSPWLA